jgi:hypothetical protein
MGHYMDCTSRSRGSPDSRVGDCTNPDTPYECNRGHTTLSLPLVELQMTGEEDQTPEKNSSRAPPITTTFLHRTRTEKSPTYLMTPVQLSHLKSPDTSKTGV